MFRAPQKEGLVHMIADIWSYDTNVHKIFSHLNLKLTIFYFALVKTQPLFLFNEILFLSEPYSGWEGGQNATPPPSF